MQSDPFGQSCNLMLFSPSGARTISTAYESIVSHVFSAAAGTCIFFAPFHVQLRSYSHVPSNFWSCSAPSLSFCSSLDIDHPGRANLVLPLLRGNQCCRVAILPSQKRLKLLGQLLVPNLMALFCFSPWSSYIYGCCPSTRIGEVFFRPICSNLNRGGSQLLS